MDIPQRKSSRMTLLYFQPPTIHSIDMIHNTELELPKARSKRNLIFKATSVKTHYERS